MGLLRTEVDMLTRKDTMAVTATQIKANQKGANPLDEKMSPAQIARRKFKSSLPRKIENRRLSALEAMGETFKLFDRFRGMIVEHGQDPDITLHAALAYCLPESDPVMLAGTIHLPGHPWLADFCDAVAKLDRPLFLGVVFIQADPDTENSNYKCTSFCAQYVGGPEAVARLVYAQKMEMEKVGKVLEKHIWG
jgi:hypothetical protein